MEWLSEHECKNVLVLADAGSDWLKAFSSTDRSTQNVVRCLRTIRYRFLKPYTVVADDGNKLVAINLKEWLTLQSLTHRYTHQEVIVWRNQQIKLLNIAWNHSLKTLTTQIDKVLFSHRNAANVRGSTSAGLLLRQSLRNPILGFCDVGQKRIHRPTVNHEARELTYNSGKDETQRVCIRTTEVLATQGQVASIPTTTELKIQLSPNYGNDVT